jgi:hypothetical protein
MLNFDCPVSRFAPGPVASHPPAVLVIENDTMTPRRRGAPCSVSPSARWYLNSYKEGSNGRRCHS